MFKAHTQGHTHPRTGTPAAVENHTAHYAHLPHPHLSNLVPVGSNLRGKDDRRGNRSATGQHHNSNKVLAQTSILRNARQCVGYDVFRILYVSNIKPM